MEIPIYKIDESKVNKVNYKDLGFGKFITDHMLVVNYNNGWKDATIVPYGNISISPAAKIFHYGQSIFEGLKAYKTYDNQIAIFRLEDAFTRFNNSAKRMAMPEIPKEIFIKGVLKLVDLDKKWMPEDKDSSIYIRPFMFATEDGLGVAPSASYQFIIFLSLAGKYYTKPVKLKIETDYVRAVKGGTGYAKAAANYAISLYPTVNAQKEGFDQVIWTDAFTHTLIEEAGVMNIMCIIGDKLITPELNDSILPGITRNTIINIVNDNLGSWGINSVHEQPLSVNEIIQAYEKKEIKEIFGVGTAAVIQKISAISYKNTLMEFDLTKDLISDKIFDYFNKVRLGMVDKYLPWLYMI